MEVETIKKILELYDAPIKEKNRTIYSVCPKCNRDDKFSILKANGAVICYHGSCQFKGFLEDWIMYRADINRKEARDILFRNQNEQLYDNSELKLELKPENKSVQLHPLESNTLTSITYPEPCNFMLNESSATEGMEYLKSRGIPIEIAMEYNIAFNIITRRIIFPVFVENNCYGWQGRAIDKVCKEYKVRSFDGLRRDLLIMFYNRIKQSPHVIISEGPIDAIKFHYCGGNIATMGKVVTPQQIDLIQKSGVKDIYLALDDDAFVEMNKLITKFSGRVFKLDIPESCRERCKLTNKKADFGECTFEECAQAFENARLIDDNFIMIYLK